MSYDLENNFEPTLFISIGETHALFTLRETYLHTYTIGQQLYKEVRSFHHFNLSQDPDEAVTKATKHSEASGLRLNANADVLREKMRDIKRADAAERERREQERLAREARWEAERQNRRQELIHLINRGIFATGPYANKPFREGKRGYISWLIDMVDQFEPDSIMQLTAIAVRDTVSDMALPKPDKDAYVGKQKERLEFNVTVTRVFRKEVADFMTGRPAYLYIVTMVTDNHECLISFSRSFSADVGDELKIKATVKEHSRYDEQAQTIIQRVKVLNMLSPKHTV